MKLRRKTAYLPWILVIAVLAITSLSCNLISNTLESLFKSGVDALDDSGMVENILGALGSVEGEGIDFEPLRHPEAEFLFEIDPFDDVIRWRFYAATSSVDETADFYIGLLPDFSIEQDAELNGYRYLVLSSDHPYSSITTAEQLADIKATVPMMESALLDVEVLDSTAHSATGRLGIAQGAGKLPEPLPSDTTLIILVYNVSSMDIGGLLDSISGADSSDGDRGSDSGDSTDQERSRENGELEYDFGDDDETRKTEPRDVTQMCGQVLAGGACHNRYFPVVEGFTRTYGSGDQQTIETVSAVSADGFSITTTSPDGTEFTSQYTCEDGDIVGWGADESVLEMIRQTPGGYTEVEVEGVPIPSSFSVGDTWPVTVTIIVGVQSGGADSRNTIVLDVEYTVVGEYDIILPAGTFTAMRIDFQTTGENNLLVTGPSGSYSQLLANIESTGSDWYVECLGLVRRYTKSSVSGIASAEHETLMELADFNLP